MRINAIKNVLYAGTREQQSPGLERVIVTTNTIASIVAVISTVLLGYLMFFPTQISTVVALGCIILLMFIVPCLNALNFTNLSRFLLCIALPYACVVVTFIPRIHAPDAYTITRSTGVYCLVLATTMIPFFTFRVQERALLFSAASVTLIALLLLHPAYFYFSQARISESYPVLRFINGNILILAAYLLLSLSILSLKRLYETFEIKNELLIRSLKAKNLELHELNKNIETQNEEIQSQSEELQQSQESLMLASTEIDKQRLALAEKNALLEQLLQEKEQHLALSSQQLVAQNNDLQQFSYTISHNLRGPVASLLGLINVYHLSKDTSEKANILGLIEESAALLETIIKDLTKIIDIRTTKYARTELVNIEEEFLRVRQMVHEAAESEGVQFTTRFAWKETQSIKAYINSILYNLISNAIQYRNPENSCMITFETYSDGNRKCIRISDNGLGIDMTKFGHDIFKLYKRFHTHSRGKGFGLYLVKQQVDALNGTIEVESTPLKGTIFTIILDTSLA